MSLYEFVVKNAAGSDVPLRQYEGKVLLVTNTASECGFTSQYEGLQKIYEDFKARGFEVLAFPCNQFGGQEPGSDAEIQTFCSTRFHVTFPVFSKVEVNGPGASPVYQWLKKEAPGILGTEAIKWNFTKFLISKDGRVLKRYAPQDKPEGIASDIELELAKV
jgi:glutathione peroxidase